MQGSLNMRINVLYFLDSLLDSSIALGSHDAPYAAYVNRDLGTIVERVVPPEREGVLNLKSARQILESWRTRRVVEVRVVDDVLRTLDARPTGELSPRKREHDEVFSRGDILRRMEEDRERHKRLRERIWILPIPSLHPPAPGSGSGSTKHPGPSPSSGSPFTPASPATTGAGTGRMMPPPPPVLLPALAEVREREKQASALELEFEQLWETTSDLGEDDLERMKQDMSLMAQETE